MDWDLENIDDIEEASPEEDGFDVQRRELRSLAKQHQIHESMQVQPDGYDSPWNKYLESCRLAVEQIAAEDAAECAAKDGATQELEDRKEILTRRVREQSSRFKMTPLLFHGTWHLDVILAAGCLAGSKPRVFHQRENCVCFSRLPETAAYFAYGAGQQDVRLDAAVLIFNRGLLRTRYKINPFMDTDIWFDKTDGEMFHKRLWEAEERIYAQRVLLKHGLLAIVEAPK